VRRRRAHSLEGLPTVLVDVWASSGEDCIANGMGLQKRVDCNRWAYCIYDYFTELELELEDAKPPPLTSVSPDLPNQEISGIIWLL
jgi:hypothetical protein